MLDLSASAAQPLLIQRLACNADVDTLRTFRCVSKAFNEAADIALCGDFTFYLNPRWCNVACPELHPAFMKLWQAASWWLSPSAGDYLSQEEFEEVGNKKLDALPLRLSFLLSKVRVLHVNMHYIAPALEVWIRKTVGHLEVARYSRLQERSYLLKRITSDIGFPAMSADMAVIFCWGWRNIADVWCKYSDETEEIYPKLPCGTRRVVYNVATMRPGNPELFGSSPPAALQEIVLLFSYNTPLFDAPYVDLSDRGPRVLVDTALEYCLAHKVKLTIVNAFAVPQGTWAPKDAEDKISWSGWDEYNITLEEYLHCWLRDKGDEDKRAADLGMVTVLSLADYVKRVGQRQFEIEWFQEPEQSRDHFFNWWRPKKPPTE